MGNGIVSSKPSVRKFNQCYMLARELGSGAFSVVRLGVNKQTGQNTAVKIVSKKKLSEDDLASLKTEIEILGSLNHPHIIRLHETFDEGSDFYIVTELVEGGELFDRIVSKTSYTEKEARDLVKTFLETMAYLHSNEIVHRDLKPENLLLCSEEDDADIKIADFGFAKRVGDLSVHETACGTPGYVAPEILRGDPYGCEVDIWSMGVICYVLLAGYPPFYDEDQKKLFRKIKEGRYFFHDEYWSHISPEAMDLIRQMLCVNQADRWTAKQLLEHPWIILDANKLVTKDLQSSIATMKKFNARRRLRAAADAVIMANRMKKLMDFITLGKQEMEKEEALAAADQADLPASLLAPMSPEELETIAQAEAAAAAAREENARLLAIEDAKRAEEEEAEAAAAAAAVVEEEQQGK